MVPQVAFKIKPVVNQVVRMHKEEAKTISRLNRKVIIKDITIDNQVQELERLLSESDSIKDVAIKNQRLADAAKMEAVVAKLEAILRRRIDGRILQNFF